MLLGVAACGSATQTTVRDTNNEVPFNGCSEEVTCTGTLEGANYEILLPTQWNGTLLIYSHGYRNAQPAPPDFQPVNTSAEPAPGWSSGEKQVGQALLDKGFALVGSSYASNGWAVEDGVAAGEQLYQFFKDKVATPQRVYLWGDSLGGLITQVLAEKHPDWVDGVAPFCGAVAGIVPNMDLSLDAAYAVRQLLVPGLKITNFASYDEAVASFSSAAQAVIAAASDTAGGGTAKVLMIAALVDAPSRTARYDGSTVESRVKGTVEALATALGFGTFGRYDVEERFGGNVSGNVASDYATRISDEDRTLIDTVGGTGETDTLLGQLAGDRITPDDAARTAAIERGGNPMGTVDDPTITLHTAADPLVIVPNESFLKTRFDKALADGKATSELVQLFTVPPATYSEAVGAPYGAGHCNFTPESRLGVITLLDDWVRRGVFPGTAAIGPALGADSGYQPLFVPSPWPDPAALEVGVLPADGTDAPMESPAESPSA